MYFRLNFEASGKFLMPKTIYSLQLFFRRYLTLIITFSHLIINSLSKIKSFRKIKGKTHLQCSSFNLNNLKIYKSQKLLKEILSKKKTKTEKALKLVLFSFFRLYFTKHISIKSKNERGNSYFYMTEFPRTKWQSLAT